MKKMLLVLAAIIMLTMFGCTSAPVEPVDVPEMTTADTDTTAETAETEDGTGSETTDTEPEATTVTEAVTTAAAATTASTTRATNPATTTTTTRRPTAAPTAAPTNAPEPEEWQGTWDVAAITAEMKAYVESLGMIWNPERTKDNSTWVGAVGTKPQRYLSNPLQKLKAELKDEIDSYYNYPRTKYTEIYLVFEQNTLYKDDYRIFVLAR